MQTSADPETNQALITTPRDEDILMGRGKRNSDRLGNVRLRKLAEEKALLYSQAQSKKQKHEFARAFIADVEASGARFLAAVSVPVNGTVATKYRPADQCTVETKIKQLLRDRLFLIKKNTARVPQDVTHGVPSYQAEHTIADGHSRDAGPSSLQLSTLSEESFQGGAQNLEPQLTRQRLEQLFILQAVERERRIVELQAAALQIGRANGVNQLVQHGRQEHPQVLVSSVSSQQPVLPRNAQQPAAVFPSNYGPLHAVPASFPSAPPPFSLLLGVDPSLLRQAVEQRMSSNMARSLTSSLTPSCSPQDESPSSPPE